MFYCVDSNFFIFLSMADKFRRSKGKKRVRIIVICLSTMGLFLLAFCLFLHILRKKKKKKLRREGK